MSIRKAKKEDSAKVAELILRAMREIVYSFIGSENTNEAYSFIYSLAQREDNQYSYTNTWVLEEGGQIIASLTGYDGSKLDQLRQPVLDLLNRQYGRSLIPEKETGEGEFYIDTLSVDPAHRGRGLGTKLLKYLIVEIVQKESKTLGLLVDIKNPRAKKLYTKLGFRTVGKKPLLGRNHEHLQLAKQDMGYSAF
jgi:ribosomal protein S18 acetylase RimI-like enzyme